MTRADALARAGISAVRKVGVETTVIEYAHGGCRPATETEIKLLGILQQLTSKG